MTQLDKQKGEFEVSNKTIPDTIIIRTWPKLIFLWPTALLAFLVGIGTIYIPGWEDAMGATFLVCLALNMMVLCFDFPRSTSLTLFITIAAIVLGLVLLNQQFAIFAPLKNWLESLELNASRDFYFSIALMMGLMYFAMTFITRFDYWELTSNELIHRTGLMGDVERFSTAGLKLNTEDQRRIRIHACRCRSRDYGHSRSPRPIVLENVLKIRRLMTQSQEMLSRRLVQVATSDGSDHKRSASHEDEQ